MKDFNAWLADTTEYLREDDTGYGWIVYAEPAPCAVCGSTEEVCECEELPLCGICKCPEDVCECEEEEYQHWLTHDADNDMAILEQAARHGDHQLQAYAIQFLHSLNQRRRPPRRMNDDEDE